MTDLAMRRGDTLTIAHTITQDGAAVDLTGKSLRLTAKRSYLDADENAVFVKTSTPAAGITITNAAEGTAQTVIDPADTSGLPAFDQVLLWDLQLMDGTYVYTVEDGTILVSPDVSVTAT